jgi:hypothetical protein
VARTPAARRPLGPTAVAPPPHVAAPPLEGRRYHVRCRELRTSAGLPVQWQGLTGGAPERLRAFARLYTVREVSGPVPRVLKGSVKPVESTIFPGELGWALAYDLTGHYATAQAIGPELAQWISDTMQPGEDLELTYEDLAPWLTLHLLETT